MTDVVTLVDRVQLGRSQVQVSALGVGTWAWGDRTFWDYGRSYGDADLEAAFRASLALGVDFFDTAEVYGCGVSERLVGRFARAAGQPLQVATKFLPYPWRLRRPSLLNALRASLDRLTVAQVALYQIHWPFPPRSTETWMAALADAVANGLTRAVGVSNYGVRRMQRAHATLAARGVPLASNQVSYSLLDRAPERNGLLQACRDLDVTLIAYSPLAMGLLTGKYTPERPPPGLRGRRTGCERLARIQPLIGLLRELGTAHGGKTATQVALNWVVCQGALPIPGAKNAAQAHENAGALGWRLTPDEAAALDKASEEGTD